MALRGPTPWLALLLAACGEPGDNDRPLDGGIPLGEPVESVNLIGVANRDCFQAERGRWHYSIGHCEPMLPAGKVEGVWVTAFEESSFFPALRVIPDANDPERYLQEIELDQREVVRLSGHAPSSANGEAYLLTFTGRRTRDPFFDCRGVPSFAFVADRLTGARYLGPMGPLDLSGMRARLEAHAERVRGQWGQAQEEAIERCRRDRDGEAGGDDQTPSHSRRPGKASAE